MSFENIFLAELRGNGFGSAEYTRTFKKRPHISKSKIDAYSNCGYLGSGAFFSANGYKQTDQRYIAATQLTYDMIISLYDVNSGSVAVARFAEFSTPLRTQLERFSASIKRPNFEFRIIGMQDGQSLEPLYGISEMITQCKLHLFEADLFGKQTRHIAIDRHSGMSYSILLNDRVYKPGELANTMTLEQFQRSAQRP